MRIVLLTTTLEGGGAARVIVNLAGHWASAGHSVCIISFEDGGSQPFYPLDQRVRVKYLALNIFSPTLWKSLVNNWRRIFSIRRAVLEERPDGLISFIDTANVRSIVAMLGTRVPVVVSERVHPAYEQIGRLWSILRRITYPLADCLVVQTEEIAGYCRSMGFGRVEVIANPVTLVPPTGDAPRLPRPCLVAVGRLYPQKGYDLLLRAFALAAQKNPDWTLAIAGGDSPMQGELEAMAASCGLAERVRFLGKVADIGGIYAQADAYVLSSTYEGFPNALCEAMASGLACVSTDCPGGPGEIIRDGEDGLLVPNGDTRAMAEALHRVMSDAALRERLGARARHVVRRFGMEHVAAQWVGLLEQCKRRKAGNRP